MLALVDHLIKRLWLELRPIRCGIAIASCRSAVLRQVIAWVVSIWFCGNAFAESPPLMLVTGPDYKPFTDSSLPQNGMHSEIVTAAFAEVGIATTISFQPWQRGYHDALNVTYDATFPYSRTDERAHDFSYSDSFYEIINRPFVLTGTKWNATDISDLAGKTMCNPDGYPVIGKVKDLIDSGEIKVESPKDMSQCFTMLKLGRVDFVQCIDDQAHAIAMRLFGDISAVTPLAVELSHVTNNLIVSRRHPRGATIISEFNRGLHALRQNGKYDEIMQRHLRQFFSAVTN